MRTHVVQANLRVGDRPFWVVVVPTDGTSWKYKNRREAWRYMIENYLPHGDHIEYRVIPEDES